MQPRINETIDRQARLQAVIRLSQEMVDAAEGGDWQGFADLEQRRRADMLACFDHSVQVSEASSVRSAIEQLMALNDQLTRCLQRARDESARQFQALQQGRRAVGAYGA